MIDEASVGAEGGFTAAADSAAGGGYQFTGRTYECDGTESCG